MPRRNRGGAVHRTLTLLLHQHQLTSTAVIAAYLHEMTNLARELDGTLARRDGPRAVRLLAELDELLERMRHDSRQNHDGIVTAAGEVKGSRQQSTVAERYARISRLWEHYLVPLRAMLDPRQAMDAALDGAERVLVTVQGTFAADPAVHREVTSTRARLTRLRHDIGHDFRESMREITPLYDALRRESQIAQGAARALEHLRCHGLRGLPLSNLLAFPVTRIEGLLHDGALTSYLHGVHGYQPARPAAIAAPRAPTTNTFIHPTAFAAAVQASLPLADALAWLLQTYPEASLTELLRAYARLHAGTYGPVRFAVNERAYTHATCTLVAQPMEVTATHAA